MKATLLVALPTAHMNTKNTLKPMIWHSTLADKAHAPPRLPQVVKVVLCLSQGQIGFVAIRIVGLSRAPASVGGRLVLPVEVSGVVPAIVRRIGAPGDHSLGACVYLGAG